MSSNLQELQPPLKVSPEKRPLWLKIVTYLTCVKVLLLALKFYSKSKVYLPYSYILKDPLIKVNIQAQYT